MQLSRLELRGFKSFADKTTVHFSPGMTAIVGPNGSGKSNITDAVRWVLGESNVRNLRGQKAEDVIFSGTENRRQMNTAEVTVVLDNSDKQLADQLGEVAITRRVYRNGDSEFFINKRACRLKDIHRLLANTGLGKDSMAIIGQNRVDAILNSKPEKRRVIFEDVAGISMFKMNKADALRRMDSTSRNMERVDDLLITLREQLIDLEIKANDTHKYNELNKEKHIYDGVLTMHKYHTAERMLTRLENENIALSDEQVELNNQLKERENNKLNLLKQNETRQEELRKLENAFSLMQQEIQGLQNKVQIIETKQLTMQESLREKQIRLEELQISIKADKNKNLLLERTLEQEINELEFGVKFLEEARDEFEQAKNSLIVAQEKWEEQEKEKKNQEETKTSRIAAFEKVKAEYGLLQAQQKDQQKNKKELICEVKEAKELFNKAQKELIQVTEDKEKILIEQAEQKKIYQEKISEINKLESKIKNIEQNLGKQNARYEVLQNWQNQHEGYSEATKAIMNANQAWKKGIHGAIGELFTVDEKYMVAIDIALGAGIHNIITAKSSDAANAIQFLKNSRKGRATFLPLDSIKPKYGDKLVCQEMGIIGLATDCIKYDMQFEKAFTYILGRTYIANDLKSATQVQKKYNGRLRIVTLAGELLQPGGSLTGGSIQRNRGSVMKRKQEQVELEDSINLLNANKQELRLKLDDEILKVKDIQSNLDEINLILQNKLTEKIEREAEFNSQQERYQRKEQVLLDIEEKLFEIANDIEELKCKELTIKALMEQSGNKTKQIDVTMSTLATLQLQQQEKHEAYTRYRLEQEQKIQNIERLKLEVTENTSRISHAEIKIEPLKNEIKKLQENQDETLPKEKENLIKLSEIKEGELTKLATEKEALYALHKKEQAKLQEANSRDEQIHTRMQTVNQKLIDMGARLTKVKLDAEQAMQNLTELGFTKDEGEALKVEGKVQDWQNERMRIEEAMVALGVINPNAIAELDTAKNREQFLENQLSDLEEAKSQLDTVIAEIDKAMGDKFIEVFDVVANNFQQIFAQLFEGGKAKLVLTKKDNILESGIDMLIQPPGKTLKQLSLLSGGERALTVIALLFAFLAYRPAPFTVLDEVDAALDEANVERFSSFLNKLETETQFIVVTHRKPTMQSAQVLHGVTMVERGISQMLSVTFDEVEEELV